jgi:LmbE family N-acetylglucosaminyl deacetylase
MAETDPAALGTILGVWAHPDDEAYLSAGIMALARRAGNRVVCVTATKGEAGSVDGHSADTMAAIRSAEMQASLEAIGVDEHHWLGYLDGGCATANPGPAVGKLVELLAAVRPDTVLTFGPEGYTEHPDHKTVSTWVSAALRRFGDAAIGLHHAVQTPEWTATYAHRFEPHGVFPPGRPPAVPAHALSIDVELPVSIAEVKWKALSAQRSQTEELISLVGERLYRDAFITTERFRAATVS